MNCAHVFLFYVEVVPCPRNNRLENQIEPIDAKRPSMSLWVVKSMSQSHANRYVTIDP